MKTLFTAILFSLLFSMSASAAELLMIHHPQCPFCKAFMNDVAPEYNETYQGKALTLVILDTTIAEDRKWLIQAVLSKNIKPFRGTPTFIIYHNGKEVGRVVGYGGKEWFYEKLDNAVKRSVQE